MKVTCTWGDGPDVLLSLDGHLMVLHEEPHDKEAWTHGAVSDGSLDLTVEEAEELAHELIIAARGARELSLSYEEHRKRVEASRKAIPDKIVWKNIK